VRATGYALSYQWFFNETNVLADATNSVLRLPDLDASDAGAYGVVVTNVTGAVTSQPALLGVIPPVEKRTVPAVKLKSPATDPVQLEFADSCAPRPVWLPLGFSLSSTSRFYCDLTAPPPPQRFYRD
jgi:hypothetical protein